MKSRLEHGIHLAWCFLPVGGQPKSSVTEATASPAPDWLVGERGGSALGVPYRAEPSRPSLPVPMGLAGYRMASGCSSVSVGP